MRLEIDRIRIDGGTQSRERLNEETVGEYAQAMRDGADFPPVVVFHDGSHNWLADGFHRVHAARAAGLSSLAADVRTGTKTDALWYAIGANKANGQRPSRGDVRHAVLLALKTWPEKSQREIAAQVGCAFQYVSRLKGDVSTSGHVSMPATRTDSLGREQPTSKPRAAREESPKGIEMPQINHTQPAAERSMPATSRGVGIALAMKAISYLQEIPPDDALRGEAMDSVIQWIKDNR